MNEQEKTFEKLIMEKLRKERSVFLLDRTLPGKEEQDFHTSLFIQHLKTNFERQLKDLLIADTDLNSLKQFANTSIEPTIFETFDSQNFWLDKLHLSLNQPLYTIDFNISSGSRVIGPPYDLTSSIGRGYTVGSQYDGKIFTLSTSGYSVAALGFYISSPELLLAAITPQGSYNWNWFVSSLEQKFVCSTGGVGVQVYLDDKQIHMHEAILWRFRGKVNQLFIGDSGSGRIADAASPAFGLGSVPIAPIYVNTGPNLRYLVWIYSWQYNKYEGRSENWAMMNMNMPFVTLDAGPPIKLN